MMDTIDMNASFNQSNMDEGDVNTDQIRCTPLKKLTLNDKRERSQVTAGDAVKELKYEVRSGPRDLDVLANITRKKEPQPSEVALNNKIINRMITQVKLTSEPKSGAALLSFLEVLQKIATKGPVNDQRLLSGISTVSDDHFVREGYTTLISPKQRLFTMCSMAVDTPLPDGATELFISNLENSLNESALVPILEKFGPLINLRIPIDARTGKNKGFAFAIFKTLNAAKDAETNLNQLTLLGKKLQAKITRPKKRLFVGNLPKSRSQEELQHHFNAFLPGFKQAVLPPVINIVKLSSSGVPQTSTKLISIGKEDRNQGFCFLEFYGSKEASLAKKVISSRKVFGVDLFVDWADADEMKEGNAAGNNNRLSYYNFNTYN